MRYREAAVAGQFYPSASADLRHLMAEYFAAEPSDSIIPKALIVPHAGYFYSGLVAAAAYRLINNAERPFSRVILFGPSHYVALEGCAVPSSDIFVTPMGEVTVDRQLAQSLTREKLAVESAKAHHWEHSLEVQLPFLQYCLDDFTLLPIVVGRSDAENVRQILAIAAQQPDTLIVVSSDLSHYHPYVEANTIDSITIDHILALNTDIHPDQACGCYSINGLLKYAKQLHWQIQCVTHNNSGDIIAHHEQRSPKLIKKVVGYASFVLY